MMQMASLLYNADWISNAISRMADQIMSDPASGPRVVIGLRTRGAILADRLRKKMAEWDSEKAQDIPIGYLDATLYRDDLKSGAGLKPVQQTDLLFPIEGKSITLVDDVLSTGRTIRAALGALFDYGRPASVRLCVMVDRGGKELPIHADFRGAAIDVPKGGFVRVRLSEIDAKGDAVYLVAPGEEDV
jgi:pyrimidine operon attenuation protein/uracil phosphoribosyltransferase